MRYRHLLLGALLWVTAGCGLVGFSEEDRFEGPMTTVQKEFTARVTSDRARVRIPYTYTNEEEGPVYVPVCGGPHPPRLEKRVEGVWIEVFVPTVNLCQEPPLEIEPGATYRGVFGADLSNPGNTHPYFRPSEISGTYRLVWSVFAEKDGRDLSGLLPLEQRMSNEFRITE